MQTVAFLTLYEALMHPPLLLRDKYIPLIQVAAGILKKQNSHWNHIYWVHSHIVFWRLCESWIKGCCKKNLCFPLKLEWKCQLPISVSDFSILNNIWVFSWALGWSFSKLLLLWSFCMCALWNFLFWVLYC